MVARRTIFKMVRRRRFLGLAAGSLAAVSGCLHSDGVEEESEGEDGDGEEETTDVDGEETDLFDDEEEETVDDLEVESPEDPEGEPPDGDPAEVVEAYYSLLDDREVEASELYLHPDGLEVDGEPPVRDNLVPEVESVSADASVSSRDEYSAVVDIVVDIEADFGGEEVEERLEGQIGLLGHDGDWRISRKEFYVVR